MRFVSCIIFRDDTTLKKVAVWLKKERLGAFENYNRTSQPAHTFK